MQIVHFFFLFLPLTFCCENDLREDEKIKKAFAFLALLITMRIYFSIFYKIMWICLELPKVEVSPNKNIIIVKYKI